MDHLTASPGDIITGRRSVWCCSSHGYVEHTFTGRVVGRAAGWPRLPIVELEPYGSGELLVLSRMSGVDVGQCVNHGPEPAAGEKSVPLTHPIDRSQVF